ncbi:matrix metallo ase-20-like protein [Labeo rohita]|uniref:Matrix metallo ase-20-like protein n=1 Tax=Labeo rohita TaxID=84645 RepID=A0A498LQ32_LABRO|nr:matrix metallo ase-20-like protein [Labeo rohita]
METLGLIEVQRSRGRTRKSRMVVKQSLEEVKPKDDVKPYELNNTNSAKLSRTDTLPQNNTKVMAFSSMLAVTQSLSSVKDSEEPTKDKTNMTEKQFLQNNVTERHKYQTDTKTHKKTLTQGRKHRIKTDTKAQRSGSECGELGQCGVPDSKSPHLGGPLKGERIPMPRTDEAVWAAGAVGFLLVLLTLSVLHTRLYRHCRSSTSLYWHDNQQDYENVGAPLPLEEDGSVHPTRPAAQNNLSLATKYLQQFYSFKADPTGRRRRSRPSFSSKLKDMQSFFGLNRTGTLNPDTLAVMRTPRCGVSDVEDYSHRRGNRWKKNIITYGVGRYTSDLPVNTVDALITSALDVWAKASPLTFLRSYSHQADIMVEFVGNGFNLYVVAAHEFGHALGLKHSQNPESVMYPTYKNRKTHNLLSSEDIMNINTLYGPRDKRPYPSPRFSWSYPSNPWYSGSYFPVPFKDTCNPDLTFDAVTTVGEAIFFFRDKYNEHNKTMSDSSPRNISDDFPEIKGPISAAIYKDGFNMSCVKCCSYESCRIARYTPDLSREEVENSLRLALKIWSDATALKFVQVNHGMADITFSFSSKDHGDFFPFDGPGGVLAHAFEPGEGIGGDVHFDDDETWTVGSGRQGFNLFTVAAHELGHSLGLSHSRDPTALMYPKYKFINSATYKLPRDDTLGIQALYGPKYWVVQKLQSKSYYGSIYEFGFPETVKQIDAAVHVSEHGKTYFFTGDYYFSYDEKRSVMDPGFPRKVNKDWPSIVGKVDAAFELDGRVHLFCRSKAFIFSHQKRRLLHIMNTNAWFGC